jgi:hypothetical protein
MTFAKLMSEYLLGVPWLLHLDVYWDELSPTFQAGEERPDMVGTTIFRNWVAVEAKGGAGNLKTVGWTRAKRQLANLVTVDGVAVHQRVAAVTFQRRRRRSPGLHVEFRDPPASGKGFDLPVSPERFITDYYQHVRRILGEEYAVLPGVVSATGSPCLGRYIPEVDLWTGITEEIARSRAPWEPAFEYAALAVDSDERKSARAYSELTDVGADGVAIVLGAAWDKRFRSPVHDQPVPP